eukprot:NODE_355_length_8917_cov_1.682581.p4 type:complete len:294 gc:universal NODE_355_length_8917_cov_1.682581:7401-8282(+)
MNVRGAPAIAIFACLALSVHLNLHSNDSENVNSLINLLKESRPTAVNLFNALIDIEQLCNNSQNVAVEIQKYAERLLKEDEEMCSLIATNGTSWIESNVIQPSEKVSVITICNTGSLATAGCGTALGVVKDLHSHNLLDMCYFLETRPYNQGARLTSIELMSDGIPSTMICDSMVAFLIKNLISKNQKLVVIVGADRITETSVYNKIGTLGLNIISTHYKVPFLVAAPSTTFSKISKTEIEERPPEEMLSINGLYNDKDIVNVKIAPDGVTCWNPAFDELLRSQVSYIITENY